ncbi:MAG: DUF642 domain-containing protein, partial [Planctomycetaceae bacterium]|nr:DUF642 domain-containing protein [Planctomycetaceae bacterium]
SALPDLAPLANNQFQTTVHPEENMVVNGSFEMGVNALNQTAIPGWTVTSGNVDVWSGYFTPDGSSTHLELDGTPGPGAVEQTITGLAAGQPYAFEFDYGSQGGVGDQARVRVQTSGGSDLIDQTLMSPNGDPNTKGWQPYRQTFTAPGDGIVKLRFESLNTNGNNLAGFNVDDVRVTRRLTNFLANGGFESGPIRANATADIPGWTVTAGNVDVWNAYFRPDGSSRYVYLEGNTPGTISQTATGLTGGQLYTLTFFYSSEGNVSEQASVKLIDSGSVTFLNQTVTSPGDPNVRGWQTHRTTFTAPPDGVVEVELQGLNSNGNGALGLAVDDVRIAAAPLNHVANGDFESGPTGLNIASNAIPGWTVTTGPVDAFGPGLLYGKAIDLNGTPGDGQIDQVVTGLAAGQVYAFQMNFVSNGNDTRTADVRLRDSGAAIIFSRRLTCDHDLGSEGWCTLRHTFAAPGDGQVEIEIENVETDGNTSLGMVVDNVAITRDVNFVVNGNFSSGPTGLNQGHIPGWNVVDQPDMHDGYSGSEYRFAVDLNGTPGNAGLRQNLVGLTAGATYTLRYWYASTDNTVKTFKVRALPTSGPALIDLTQSTLAVQQPGNGGWREARHTFTAPADGRASIVFQDIESDGNTSYGALIENAFLVEVVFSWPGLSAYGAAAVLAKDFNQQIAVGSEHQLGWLGRRGRQVDLPPEPGCRGLHEQHRARLGDPDSSLFVARADETALQHSLELPLAVERVPGGVLREPLPARPAHLGARDGLETLAIDHTHEDGIGGGWRRDRRSGFGRDLTSGGVLGDLRGRCRLVRAREWFAHELRACRGVELRALAVAIARQEHENEHKRERGQRCETTRQQTLQLGSFSARISTQRLTVSPGAEVCTSPPCPQTVEELRPSGRALICVSLSPRRRRPRQLETSRRVRIRRPRGRRRVRLGSARSGCRARATARSTCRGHPSASRPRGRTGSLCVRVASPRAWLALRRRVHRPLPAGDPARGAGPQECVRA